jgi:hypothetical protein
MASLFFKRNPPRVGSSVLLLLCLLAICVDLRNRHGVQRLPLQLKSVTSTASSSYQNEIEKLTSLEEVLHRERSQTDIEDNVLIREVSD